MIIYLVPARSGRYELYSEAPESEDTGAPPEGRFRRWLHRANEQWGTLVAQARQGGATGWLARLRDRVIGTLAESIAEQRTLWALRSATAVMVLTPSALTVPDARILLMTDLAHARRQHLRGLIVDSVIFVASGLLALVPGPNLIAYCFAFRCVGHLQSWRGARQGMDGVRWTFRADAALTELQALVDVPRSTRAHRVRAIAERLNLRDLAAFFDRVAVPSV
ncbi:MAG: hypothetical protein FJW27_02330 [Acidimicrobiia bacterium]|nr:hypothetical protein [Acidimicrobiia bacterium]